MEGQEILKRSSLLSLLLLAAIVFVGAGTYNLWQEGPWDLPKPAKAKGAVVEETKQEPPRLQLVSTKNIIDKNLFDPERGAGRVQESEASAIAMQRIRSMVLMGTAILGNSRYAILQGPSETRPPVPGAPAGQQGNLRLKLGDTVEGFKLSEIHEKKVVFTKGSSKVEVALDFFRKVDDSKEQSKAPAQTRPGVAPSIPRRPGVPVPPVAP